MDKKLEENMPIYMQIMGRVKEAIASGELKAGERIASVREMAAEFEVNPNTMQRALNELEREDLLVSERTAGRYVTRNETMIDRLKQETAEAAADRFRKEMAALGFSEEEMFLFFRQRCEMNTAGKEGVG